MVETGFRLPATISAGMTQKIRDALRQPIDGHPASQGMPMEAEVKHYYNYFLIRDNIDFDTFISVLSDELSRIVPDLKFNMTWVRQCDALNSVRTARRSVAKLRTYVHERRQFSVSFWDILWKLQEVSFKAHGITPAEAGTTLQELRYLAWQFLLREVEYRIRDLRDQLRFSGTLSARQSFILVDDMFAGIPIPESIFCANKRSHYSRNGPYHAYRAFATGRRISPEALGWSRAELNAARKHLFPELCGAERPTNGGSGPTAPGTIEQVPTPAGMLHETLKTPVLTDAVTTRLPCPKTWAAVVELTMRKIPQLPQTAIYPS
jgi:hypothetical protein